MNERKHLCKYQVNKNVSLEQIIIDEYQKKIVIRAVETGDQSTAKSSQRSWVYQLNYDIS